MSDNKDRRSFHRLVIPQATAALMDKMWFDLVKNYLSFIIPVNSSKSIIIKDISKSGACLVCEHRHECGDPIHLVVSIPGEKNILLKGHVRWVKKQDNQVQYCIGTQFYAYGSSKNLNSLRSLEKLRLVHERDIVELDLDDSELEIRDFFAS
jgi:hypothetical protein